MSDMYKTTYHRDGTITYWNVYSQIWRRIPADKISDETLATMSADERAKIARISRDGGTPS